MHVACNKKQFSVINDKLKCMNKTKRKWGATEFNYFDIFWANARCTPDIVFGQTLTTQQKVLTDVLT